MDDYAGTAPTPYYYPGQGSQLQRQQSAYTYEPSPAGSISSLQRTRLLSFTTRCRRHSSQCHHSCQSTTPCSRGCTFRQEPSIRSSRTRPNGPPGLTVAGTVLGTRRLLHGFFVLTSNSRPNERFVEHLAPSDGISHADYSVRQPFGLI